VQGAFEYVLQPLPLRFGTQVLNMIMYIHYIEIVQNLKIAISTVNFCESFCTCSFSSLGQDPTVESAKK
jgi:hypothetical protein